MRIQRAFPRLKGLLAIHANTHGLHGDAKSEKGALPSMHEAPVTSFLPMCHSSKGKELEDRLLADFMASNEDRKSFESRVKARQMETEAESDEGHCQTEVIHVSMRNVMGQSIPVRLYHVRFMDLWGESACHLVGICEAAESTVMDAAEGSSPDLSQAKPDTVPACPANVEVTEYAPLTRRDLRSLPLIRFNALDDRLAVLFVNDSWAKQFGLRNGSLSDWFGEQIFFDFRTWVRKIVESAVAGGWTRAANSHRFRTLKCTFPNGVKKLTELRVLIPDPSTHYIENEQSFILELVGRAVCEKSSDSSSSKSSTEKNSSGSSRSTHSRSRPRIALPTIEENTVVRRHGSTDHCHQASRATKKSIVLGIRSN
jgi:hypothetical protein